MHRMIGAHGPFPPDWRGVHYRMMWRTVMDRSRRMGLLVAMRLFSPGEAEAEMMRLSYRLGCGTGPMHEELISDAIMEGWNQAETDALRRIRTAMLPMIANREPSARILDAARVANQAVFPAADVRKLVAQHIHDALQAAARRQGMAHAR